MSEKIKNTLNFQFPLMLAPMVGLTHVVLRQIIHDYLPQNVDFYSPTEMLNSRKIPHETLGGTPETLYFENENNLVPQILGNEKESIQLSITKLKNEWGSSSMVRGIDINMGCPVQKALKHNYGVALMGDVDYAASVVEYAATASDLPVSVKLRAVGSEKSIPELIQFVTKLQNAGAQWITLHPRTAEQKRRGTADWNQITELKKALKIPVIGNGDIQTVDDIFMMLEQTKCDAVMSGRALATRPWMVWQLGDRLKLTPNQSLSQSKVPISEFEEGAEYGKMLLKFIRLCDFYFCQKLKMKPEYAFRKIQFFVRTTHVWLEFGHALMSEVNKSKSFSELETRVVRFFESEQRMFGYTELRQ